MPARRADDVQYTLLLNGSATGPPVAIKGGEYIFAAEGTINGATISLDVQLPNGNWTRVQVFTGSVVAFTVLPNSQTGVDLPAGYVRCAIAGGPPSGVNAFLVGLG